MIEVLMNIQMEEIHRARCAGRRAELLKVYHSPNTSKCSPTQKLPSESLYFGDFMEASSLRHD